ncbi:unnamed protein product [Effrenium voratum]|nr:unnamed protein product [Effrenium voratum]
MTRDVGMGYACCLIASVAYAVNFLPVKKYETGDGIFFTFAMSLGILMVGLAMGLNQHDPFGFEPLAALGGVIFTMGNLLCPLVIQLIGLGLGLTIWDLSNMLMGWFTGRFGLFGVDQEISERPLFNYIGLALACVSLVFMHLAAHFDTKPKEVESQNLEGAEDLECSASDLKGERPDPMTVVMGTSLATLAGVLFGATFKLPQDLLQGQIGQNHSRYSLDYVFSHFLGIFVSAAASLLVYIIVRRRRSYAPLNLVLPAMCSGVIWALGTVAWFQANAELGCALATSKSRCLALIGVMIRLPGEPSRAGRARNGADLGAFHPRGRATPGWHGRACAGRARGRKA